MEQTMSHQMMGYDRTSTMFSPDGRLLQVEYAKKTVKQGSTAIGIVCKDGVLLMTDKRIMSRLIISEAVEKLFQVDQHIAAAVSGFVSDGRVLVERARVRAQQYRVTFDEPIDTQELVKGIADMKQWFTQVGGARPFGVSLLFAGMDDNGAKLFMTEPSGIFFQYRAAAVGEGEVEVTEILDKEYKENMNLEEGMKLAVRAMKKVLKKDFDINRISGAYIDSKKEYHKLSVEELKRLAK